MKGSASGAAYLATMKPLDHNRTKVSGATRMKKEVNCWDGMAGSPQCANPIHRTPALHLKSTRQGSIENARVGPPACDAPSTSPSTPTGSFLADDGWAIASHIALSALMAMFPFFIVLTSLAGSFGSSDLADEVAQLMLAIWPEEVALPIAREIHNVLTTAHTGVLTLGLVLAIYFASSGVESLRIGLNRAYGVVETRNWLLLRLESIGYVLLAALGLLALGFLIVLGPLLFRTALRYAPWLEPLEGTFTFFRFAIASVVLVIALFVAHKWLPAGRRRVVEILPGIVADAGLVARGRHRLRPLSRRVFLSPT